MNLSQANLFLIPLFVVATTQLALCTPTSLRAEVESSNQGEKAITEANPVSTQLPVSRINIRSMSVVSANYFIQRPTMGVGLTYESKSESRTTGITTVKDTSHKFKERVRFETEGWVYHPALMQYSLMIEPEWVQGTEERSPGESARVDSFSPDYSVSAKFLEQKPYTLNIYTSRREIPVWAPFAGNTESVVDSYGAGVQLKYKMLPTTLGYDHIETDQTGFFTSQSTRENFTLSSRHRSAKSNTSFVSTYTDNKRSSQGIVSHIKALSSLLSNNYRVTEDNRVNLNSILSYRLQDTINLDTENTRLREHLSWKHLKNLQSNYTFTHYRQESGAFNSDQTSLEARLTHLLYENLTTNLGGSAQYYNYLDGRENAFDGFLDFDYSRPLSFGTLNLSTGWDYLYTDRSGSTTSVTQITNEPHILSTGRETFLDNFNVEIDSILVTDSTGTIVYFLNIDYSIDEINGSVRIRPLTFGSINDGQSVFVSYRYLRDSEFDDTLFTENYGINLDLLSGWFFSYNYLRARQSIISGQPPQNQIDDTIHRAQVRYDIKWSDTSLTYEDSNRQSDRAYSQWEFQETLRFRPMYRFYFTLRGYLGETDYKNRDETREFYGGVTTLDWLLNNNWKYRLEGYYDNTKGDVEDTLNSGVKTNLEFRYRIWKLRLSYELTEQDNRINDFKRSEQLVRFEITRPMW